MNKPKIHIDTADLFVSENEGYVYVRGGLVGAVLLNSIDARRLLDVLEKFIEENNE